jgi:hypothetical protein
MRWTAVVPAACVALWAAGARAQDPPAIPATATSDATPSSPVVVETNVRAPGGDVPPTEIRLDIGQLYSLDDLTTRHDSFTDLRGTLDGHREAGETRFEMHFDGRIRKPWTDVTPEQSYVTRAYATVGGADRGWTIGVGRQTIGPLNMAQVDGASFDLGVKDDLHLTVFGGAMPDPIDNTITKNFTIAGFGYESRSMEFHQMGGFAADLYKGSLDRAYLTERIFWLPSRMWNMHAFALVDLFAPRGFIQDLLSTGAAMNMPSAVDKIDLTSAHLTIMFRPTNMFDMSLYGAHNHTILPHLWWIDYLAQERARLGFVLDGLEPVGTRRSTARLVANVHITPFITPYAVARTDYRHEDHAKAYEGTGGLKIDLPDIGYADASGSVRDFFGTKNQLAALSIGTNFGTALGVDASATAMRVQAPNTGRELLYDLGGTVWLDMKAIFKPLGDFRLMGTYQAFIQPDITFQVMMVRVGYRFRDT